MTKNGPVLTSLTFYNLGKTLTYESNEPTQISFEGGFLEKPWKNKPFRLFQYA